MITSDGKKAITVNKAKLLATLKENRAKHVEQYKLGMVGYQQALIRRLEKELERAKELKPVSLNKLQRDMPVPSSYEASYDTTIQMLEWEEGEIVRIDEHEFNRYVLNKWEWHDSFEANTSTYISDDELGSPAGG